MTSQKAYSTDFIIKDLTNHYFSVPSNQRRLYSKLVDTLKTGKLQIAIENKGIKKLEKLEKAKGNGEFEKAKFELVESLISSGRIRILTENIEIPDCLDQLTIRTTHKEMFSPAADDSFSTSFYDQLPDSSLEEKIGAVLKKALIDKSKFDDGSIEYLFETRELTPIEKGDEFQWYPYLKPYSIHTNRVYIRDPYFYANNLDNKLNDILGPLLYGSYSTPIKVEIIAELEDIPKEQAIGKIKKWLEEQDNRLDIQCYYQRGIASHLFHDRYLFTDYWALKIPAGLDIGKDGKASKYTIPTLIGRYAPNASSWKYINENWEIWKTKKCKKVEDYK